MNKLAGRILIIVLVTIALAEVAFRLYTTTSERNGTPMVGKVALLPYRPAGELVLEKLEQANQGGYFVLDDQLGWTLGRNARSSRKDHPYVSNAQGIRAAPGRIYSRVPPDGKMRIVTVGDSFTHGDLVSNDQTWQYFLEKLDPNLEVINLGVPAYGTDQAFMRWRRDGRKFESHVVILGIWPEDIARNLNMIRFYLVPTSNFLSKPRFILKGSLLEIVNPLSFQQISTALSEPQSSDVLAHEYWYVSSETVDKPYYISRLARVVASFYRAYQRKRIRERLYSGQYQEGMNITVAIAEQFSREVSHDGAVPIILLIPARGMLEQRISAREYVLAQRLRKRNIDFIDLDEPFRRAAEKHGIKELYRRGHHSPLGNRIIAEALAGSMDRLADKINLGRGQ